MATNKTTMGLRVLLVLTAAHLSRAADPASAPTTAPTQKDYTKWILTPPAPSTPRINGPRIFGVRPGSPVLYSIPATGDRPIRFSADGLPAGLALDAQSGRITGTVKDAGEYKLTLRATNEKGSAEKAFTFKVGDEIALTPPMGWNSWNCWAGAVDQEKVLRSAKAMVSSGLVNHGWTFINIDDAWQGERGGEMNALQPDLKKFPDMKALCDEIHAMGLKAGIYSSPWVRTYAGRLGGSAENEQGLKQDWSGKQKRNAKELPYAIGKFKFTGADAKQWAGWGIDYLKYDWGPVEAPEAKEMADALRATGRDIVYSVSNNAAGNIIKVIDDLAPLVNAWRTTNDINDSWKNVANIGFNQEKWFPHLRPAHYPDADMLVVGWVGWGPKLHPTKLTPDEQYSHVTLWCLLSSPLLIGCDLERLDPFTLSLLTNDEVLAVNQDTLAKAPRRMTQPDNIEIYIKDLDDGARALGVFNRGEKSAEVTLKWADLNAGEVQTVRDLWRQQDIAGANDQISLSIAPHGAAMLKVAGKH